MADIASVLLCPVTKVTGISGDSDQYKRPISSPPIAAVGLGNARTVFLHSCQTRSAEPLTERAIWVLNAELTVNTVVIDRIDAAVAAPCLQFTVNNETWVIACYAGQNGTIGSC